MADADPTTRVEIESQNKAGKLPVFEVDSKDADAPGIIVIQEWWGVNDQLKKRCAAFAGAGFRALVPDLYRGNVASYKERERAHHLMSDLDWPGAVQDIAAAASYLQSKGSKKVGVVGFCMGGALVLASAVRIPNVHAGSCYYGIPSPELADTAQTKVPVQCHFGLKDEMAGFSAPADADNLEANLKKAGIEYEFFRYPNCGHAFANDARPEVYSPEDAKAAFDRSVAFFKKHLA